MELFFHCHNCCHVLFFVVLGGGVYVCLFSFFLPSILEGTIGGVHRILLLLYACRKVNKRPTTMWLAEEKKNKQKMDEFFNKNTEPNIDQQYQAK